jgi:hypothetical protein
MHCRCIINAPLAATRWWRWGIETPYNAKKLSFFLCELGVSFVPFAYLAVNFLTAKIARNAKKKTISPR